MKKSYLLIPILFLLSGVTSAGTVSGFTVLKDCGADPEICGIYNTVAFDFNVNYAGGDTQESLMFGDDFIRENLRQDTMVTITEMPPTGWADVQWMMDCTLVNGVGAASVGCVREWDVSTPNQVSFYLEYDANPDNLLITAVNNPVVPVPAAVWLFGSGLLGLVGMARRKKAKH